MTEEISNDTESDFYLFNAYYPRPGRAAHSILPAWPELTAYIFNHENRRANNALINLLNPLVRIGDEDINCPGTQGFTEDLRRFLDITKNGLSYDNNPAQLIHDKSALLGNIAPDKTSDSIISIRHMFTYGNDLPSPRFAY